MYVEIRMKKNTLADKSWSKEETIPKAMVKYESLIYKGPSFEWSAV